MVYSLLEVLSRYEVFWIPKSIVLEWAHQSCKAYLFMSSLAYFVALYKMHFCLCRNFGVMTSSYGHNKMHSFLRGNLNVLYNIQMIRLWTNHIQFRMRYRKIMWSNVPNVPNPSWQCFCSETMKKLVFVVWRFHVCPNDWQLNQFHINPKREMHNLSTSASKTTISFKLCSRVFNWILFSWIFFNRIFCSLSDRINLWGRTNRWSRSDKIYPNFWSLPNCRHETHVHRMKQQKLSLLHNSWIGWKRTNGSG